MTVRYRPSNGTEGEMFYADWCGKCQGDAAHREDPESNTGCDILLRSYAFDAHDPEYPEEWTYDDNGSPCCTAFVLEVTDGKAASTPKPRPRCPNTIDMFDSP